MRIGVTGHQHLDDPSGWDWAGPEILRRLKGYESPLVGVTSLAVGADQLFARMILDCGGSFEVVIPFDNYDGTFPSTERAEYERLLSLANHVEVMKEQGSQEEMFLQAGKRVVDKTSLLFAVWDGEPAGGVGGTADIVEYAQTVGMEVICFNPVQRTIKTLS